ncbi:MAG: hypothetical protein NZ455_03345 [Bacteroidia bacterium]|nr:hypothetical protein [Bacteroidia bacterium]MDW8347660.1 hypothetical protein [Bacteroidia bacterium]
MRTFTLFLAVLFFQWAISQVVYEKILVPISFVYDHTELDKVCKEYYYYFHAECVAGIQKAAKSYSCKEYLVGVTYPYTSDDECGDKSMKLLFQKVIKDSLRWVKIDVASVGNFYLTSISRSVDRAKVSAQQNFMYHNFEITLLPLCNDDKKVFSKKDTNLYLELTIKADKSETQHLLFKTFKQVIYFAEMQSNGNLCKFFTNPLMSESKANEIYQRMANNVQFVGRAMKEQNDSQNQMVSKECKYKGKMLFDAMQMTTVEDIKRFLSYCVLRSEIYRNNTWSISEVYAQWLVSGMPLPEK